MGEPGLPLLGKSLEMIREGWASSREMRDKYGDVFWSHTFGVNVVSVVGADAVQEVLQNKGKVKSDKVNVRFADVACANRYSTS